MATPSLLMYCLRRGGGFQLRGLRSQPPTHPPGLSWGLHHWWWRGEAGRQSLGREGSDLRLGSRGHLWFSCPGRSRACPSLSSSPGPVAHTLPWHPAHWACTPESPPPLLPGDPDPPIPSGLASCTWEKLSREFYWLQPVSPKTRSVPDFPQILRQ